MAKFLFITIFFTALLVKPDLASPAPENFDVQESIQDLKEIEESYEFQVFRTTYTTIYFIDEYDLEAFLWKITGDKDINIYSYPGIAKSRVDRIVEKVQSILDMYPARFRVDVYVHPHYDMGPIAFFSYETNSITTFADKSTDRTFAHEVAHAVVRSYFKVLPPKTIREMLSQYVDEHLWDD